MAFVLLVEGSDVSGRDAITDEIERRGHEIRAAADPRYKRATWGLRPEDLAEIKALTGEAQRWQPA